MGSSQDYRCIQDFKGDSEKHIKNISFRENKTNITYLEKSIQYFEENIKSLKKHIQGFEKHILTFSILNYGFWEKVFNVLDKYSCKTYLDFAESKQDLLEILNFLEFRETIQRNKIKKKQK